MKLQFYEKHPPTLTLKTRQQAESDPETQLTVIDELIGWMRVIFAADFYGRPVDEHASSPSTGGPFSGVTLNVHPHDRFVFFGYCV
jgi:hypothetical protein